ncbi:MAG: metalloregulator ArsR/SmtB family transcription factor [Myxococcota bacterium]
MDRDRRIKEDLYGLFASLGKALSSPARLRILDLLSQRERSVESIAAQAELSVANTSAHLRALHSAGLVRSRREGRYVVYELSSKDVFPFLRTFQSMARRSLAEVDRMVRAFYERPEELDPIEPEELLRRIREGDVTVVDVRPEDEYHAAHLPGAILVPPEEVEDRIAELPADREIVAYCRGPYCLYSSSAVVRLKERGRRARRLSIGLPDWLARGLPVEESTAMVGP